MGEPSTLFVGLVVLALFVVFVTGRLRPDVAVLSAVALLMASRQLTSLEVLSVASNAAPITIACLFIICATLERAGVVNALGELLGRHAGSTPRGVLVVLMLAAFIVSAPINNTPVVMILMPVAITLARSRGMAPSKVLMPLSYATVLGGVTTLMGTSTNLLVDTMSRQLGQPPIGMFEMTPAALGLGAIGLTFLAVLAPRCMPERQALAPRPGTPGAGPIVGRATLQCHRAVCDADITARNGLQVIAIQRRGANAEGDLDDCALAVGGPVLAGGTRQEVCRFIDGGEPSTLGRVQARPFDKRRAWIATSTALAVMLLSACDVLPIEGAALVGAAAVVLTRCIEMDEAYKCIQWPILVTIYGMLAVTIAMQKAGLVAIFGEAAEALGAEVHPLVVLSLVALVTSVVTEFVSNQAVAVLMTPIAIGIAQALDLDPRPFVMAVMFCASASFATPIGYQTNTIVYTAGGYRFTDFFRLGIPLNVIVWLYCTFVIPLFWPLAP